jgi:hypothetical protein
MDSAPLLEFNSETKYPIIDLKPTMAWAVLLHQKQIILFYHQTKQKLYTQISYCVLVKLVCGSYTN